MRGKKGLAGGKRVERDTNLKVSPLATMGGLGRIDELLSGALGEAEFRISSVFSDVIWMDQGKPINKSRG